MTHHRKSTLAAVLAGLFVAAAAQAQGDAAAWRNTVVLYGMGAAIEGTAGMQDFEVPIDISIADLFDSLEAGAMAAYRGENDDWAVMVDATFMGLGATQRSRGGRLKGDIDLDQTTLMVTAGRKISDHVEALVGLAWFDLSTKLVLEGPLGTRSGEAGASWIDPTFGLAWHRPFGERWRADLRADIGGFGVGSNLLVHALADFRWQASERVGVAIGYRLIQFNYEEGRGASYESYDLTEQGPLAGVTFSF